MFILVGWIAFCFTVIRTSCFAVFSWVVNIEWMCWIVRFCVAVSSINWSFYVDRLDRPNCLERYVNVLAGLWWVLQCASHCPLCSLFGSMYFWWSLIGRDNWYVVNRVRLSWYRLLTAVWELEDELPIQDNPTSPVNQRWYHQFWNCFAHIPKYKLHPLLMRTLAHINEMTIGNSENMFVESVV